MANEDVQRRVGEAMNIKSNNAPHATVLLTKEQYDFLIHNCDANIRQAIGALDPCGPMSGKLSLSTMEKLVELTDSFRSLKQAAERGLL